MRLPWDRRISRRAAKAIPSADPIDRARRPFEPDRSRHIRKGGGLRWYRGHALARRIEGGFPVARPPAVFSRFGSYQFLDSIEGFDIRSSWRGGDNDIVCIKGDCKGFLARHRRFRQGGFRSFILSHIPPRKRSASTDFAEIAIEFERSTTRMKTNQFTPPPPSEKALLQAISSPLRSRRYRSDISPTLLPRRGSRSPNACAPGLPGLLSISITDAAKG